jgi:hypothetical protein
MRINVRRSIQPGRNAQSFNLWPWPVVSRFYTFQAGPIGGRGCCAGRLTGGWVPQRLCGRLCGTLGRVGGLGSLGRAQRRVGRRVRHNLLNPRSHVTNTN